MRLLQSTWAELLTLTTAFRSLEQFNDQTDVGSGDIDSAGGSSEENSSGGLKLRYATDYWLDEKLARECGAATIGVPLSSNGSGGSTTSISSATSGTTTVTSPTVLDIFNMVSIYDFNSL
jgi:hypothetical protein